MWLIILSSFANGYLYSPLKWNPMMQGKEWVPMLPIVLRIFKTFQPCIRSVITKNKIICVVSRYLYSATWRYWGIIVYFFSTFFLKLVGRYFCGKMVFTMSSSPEGEEEKFWFVAKIKAMVASIAIESLFELGPMVCGCAWFSNHGERVGLELP